MHIASLSFVATLIAAVAAQATEENAFIIPEDGLNIQAGEPTTIRWEPSTDGPVVLRLRSGAASALNEGIEIASNIPNSGSYTFTVPADTTRNSDYALSIAPVSDPSQENYTPQFVVESSNTVASTTDDTSASAATASATDNDSASTAATSATDSTSASMESTSAPSSAMSTSSAAMSTGMLSSSMMFSNSSTASASRTSSMRPSSTAAPTETDTEDAAETEPVDAPDSGAKALNVQSGLAALILGALALF